MTLKRRYPARSSQVTESLNDRTTKGICSGIDAERAASTAFPVWRHESDPKAISDSTATFIEELPAREVHMRPEREEGGVWMRDEVGDQWLGVTKQHGPNRDTQIAGFPPNALPGSHRTAGGEPCAPSGGWNGHDAALTLGSERETSEDVLVREDRKVGEDLRFGHARRQIAQDVTDCDAGAADAGLAETNGWIEADPVEEVHASTLRCCERRVK